MCKPPLIPVLLAVCVAASSPARAQSLADAAKSAEEQRQSSGRSVNVYTNQSLRGSSGYESLLGDGYLLAEHFNAYSSAHADIVGLRVRSRDLDDYLVRSELGAEDRFDLEDAYGQDVSIVRALQFNRLDVRAYFKTDAAFARALRDQKLSKADREQLPAARRLNAQYVEEHSLTQWLGSSWQEQRLDMLHRAKGR